jgi:hypothetical protein
MADEVLGLRRDAVALQVGRRRRQEHRHRGEPPRDDVAVFAGRGGQEGDVVPLHHRRIGDADVDVEGDARVLLPESRDDGGQHLRGQCRRCGQVQVSRQLAVVLRDLGVGLVDVVQDGAQPLGIRRTDVGDHQPARGPLQQPCAQVRLQVGDQAGDDGGRQVERPRRGGEASLLHHAAEHTHRQEAVHGRSRAAVAPEDCCGIGNDALSPAPFFFRFAAPTFSSRPADPTDRGAREPPAPELRFSNQARKHTMNSRLLPATLAVFAALSVGQAFAADEANQFNPNAIAQGTATRAQVKAELAQAVRAGEIATDVETGQSLSQPFVTHATSALTRAEVKAELVQAARAGQLPLADQAF